MAPSQSPPAGSRLSAALRHGAMAAAFPALLAACGPLSRSTAPTARPLQPTPRPSATHTPAPSPSPTRTPPQAPTETPFPTPTPTWEPFPTPSRLSPIDPPPPAPRLPLPPSAVNVVILGSDARPGVGGYRTDTILFLSLDPQAGRVVILSIPRDLYVFIPGWGMGRINTAEPRGGFIMLRDTFRYNLGLDLHHWVRLGFSGFERAINLLGGIEVLATAPLNDECGGVQWHYQAGKTYTMDGFAALCYARMRKRSSDFDRLRRQQEILIAIFQRIISLDGLQRVPELYGTFQPTFESDMQLRQVLDLLPLAVQVARQPERLIPARIDPRMAHGWRVPGSGAALLLPDRPALTAYLWELFRPQSAPPQVPLQWR